MSKGNLNHSKHFQISMNRLDDLEENHIMRGFQKGYNDFIYLNQLCATPYVNPDFVFSPAVCCFQRIISQWG